MVYIPGINRRINNTYDIQETIDYIQARAGTGILTLQPGTYIVNNDIVIPSNIYLVGEVRDSTILDFDGQPYSVTSVGTDVYTDGTVTIADGDTTLIGTGTVWTVDMIGLYVFLNDSYWFIEDVVSDTEITLDSPYSGVDLVDANYAIANATNNVKVDSVTIQNSALRGLGFDYNVQSIATNINVYGCATGFQSMRSVAETYELLTIDSNDINIDFTDVYSWTIDNAFINNSLVGENMKLTRSGNASFYNNGIDNATTMGISLTDCVNIGFNQMTVSRSGTNGVELISGNADIVFGSSAAIDSNVRDGIKITATSDRTIITGNPITNNGANGVNIVDATSDDTLIVANTFSGNGTPATDSGTGTLIRSNIGLADN